MHRVHLAPAVWGVRPLGMGNALLRTEGRARLGSSPSVSQESSWSSPRGFYLFDLS